MTTDVLLANPVVWTEIRVSDLEKAVAFYGAVLRNGMKISYNMGPMPMADFPGAKGAVAGHLVQGTPATNGAGPLVHFAVPDTLDAARTRVKAAGGTAEDTDIEIPDGTFFYATDPDGNAFGLFKGKE